MYDYLGEIAIINNPNLSENELKKIIDKILSNHKNIKAIYIKKRRSGEFRVQELELVWGQDVDEIICKENKCIFKK